MLRSSRGEDRIAYGKTWPQVSIRYAANIHLGTTEHGQVPHCCCSSYFWYLPFKKQILFTFSLYKAFQIFSWIGKSALTSKLWPDISTFPLWALFSQGVCLWSMCVFFKHQDCIMSIVTTVSMCYQMIGMHLQQLKKVLYFRQSLWWSLQRKAKKLSGIHFSLWCLCSFFTVCNTFPCNQDPMSMPIVSNTYMYAVWNQGSLNTSPSFNQWLGGASRLNYTYLWCKNCQSIVVIMTSLGQKSFIPLKIRGQTWFFSNSQTFVEVKFLSHQILLLFLFSELRKDHFVICCVHTHTNYRRFNIYILSLYDQVLHPSDIQGSNSNKYFTNTHLFFLLPLSAFIN